MAGHDETVLEIDWCEVARTALSSAVLAGIVSGALRVVTSILEANHPSDDEGPFEEEGPIPAEDEAGEEAVEAATLLGVAVTASEDEIRAALRGRLGSSHLHPDQGGDGEEAKRLIAAKNLLVERARSAVR